MLNTLLASAIGIVVATILGFLVGVMRLSRNCLVSRIADRLRGNAAQRAAAGAAAVLVRRASASCSRAVRQAINLGDLFFLSNRGIYAPRPMVRRRFRHRRLRRCWSASSAPSSIRRWARRRQAATGQQFPVLLGRARPSSSCCRCWSALRSAVPLTWEIPELKGFNFQGGLVLPAGARGAGPRPAVTYTGGLHRRDRARRHHGGQPRADRGVARARPASRAGPCGW